MYTLTITLRNWNYFAVTRLKLLFRKVRLNVDVRTISMDRKLSQTEASVLNAKAFGRNVNKTSRRKHKGYLYLDDPLSADSIAFHLCENWKEGYIFEVNPGPGVLSKAILNAGVPSLRVFEKNEEYLPSLKELSKTHSNLEIIEEDFLFLPSLESRLLDKYPKILDSFFDKIPENSWERGVPFRIFSIISSKRSIKFFRFLLPSLTHRMSIFSYGRCELFLLLSESEYVYMTAEHKDNLSSYRWCTVFYNVFFDIKCLEKFSWEVFTPLPSSRKKMEGSNFYFMKLTPKPEILTPVENGKRKKLPDSLLYEFHYFIRHHFNKRTSYVIPAMEVWIPCCGPRLILKGMHVFTRFGDLCPEQLLELFVEFSLWPEYKDSLFHDAVRRYLEKHPLPFVEEETV